MPADSQVEPHGVYVRLGPEVMRILGDMADETKSGRAGGVPHLIRCMVHQALGLPPPEGLHGQRHIQAEEVARQGAERGLTLAQIGHELEKAGVKTKRGHSSWDPAQVRRLLRHKEKEGPETDPDPPSLQELLEEELRREEQSPDLHPP